MSKATEVLDKLNEKRTYGQKKAKKLGDTEATYTGDKHRGGDWVGELDPKKLADLDPKLVQQMYDKASQSGDEVVIQKFMAMALGKTGKEGQEIGLKVIRREYDNDVQNWKEVTDATALLIDSEKGNFGFNFENIEDKIEFQQLVTRFFKELETSKKVVRGNPVKEYNKLFTYLLYNWNVLDALSDEPKYLKEVLTALDQMEKDKKNTWSKGLAAAYICPNLTPKQQNNAISDIEKLFKNFLKPHMER